MSGFDVASWRRYLLVRKAMRPPTVKRTVERMLFATLNGFDLESFLKDADLAQVSGERYLETRLGRGGSVHVINNDAKWIMALGEYLGYELSFPWRKTPPAQLRALSKEEVGKLYAYRHPDPDTNRLRRAVVCLELVLGLRVSELAKLEMQDLDPRQSRVHVRFPAKRGMRRWLPVPRWVWSKRRPLGAYLRHRPHPTDGSQALWVSTFRGWNSRKAAAAMDGEYLRNMIYEIGHDAGVKFNCNIARHTVATDLHQRGFDILYIKFFLGHASISSTQVYAEISPQDVLTLYQRKPLPDPLRGTRQKAQPFQRVGRLKGDSA